MRTTIARWTAVLCAAATLGAACGSGDGDGVAADQDGVSAVAVGDRQGPSADPSAAGRAVTAFGGTLFAAVRAGADDPDANLTISPASVAVALAMLEPGATGDAATQLRRVLAIDDPGTYHASMNALEQDLEARVPDPVADDDGDEEQDPGEVTVRLANAAYLQQGYPFESAYLETIGANYGPALNEVDFRADPDAVAHAINAFVAGATNDRIPELVADGVISPDTVLALVNALYLKASWLESFEADATADAPFTRADGTEVTVPMMRGASGASSQGAGWRGAEKPYVGGLAAQFILPDEGRFDEVAADLGRVVAEFDANRTVGAELSVPRFEVRANRQLDPALRALGLTAPYEPGHLLGIAADDRLVLSKVIHETWVAMDEEGTEAAAATVALMVAVSAPVEPPRPLTLDRPFLYRIYDQRSGATLFLGQVTDPTAG
ncbi:MAG: serpin family protein [Acidimicrobiales bacterium]